MLNNFSKEKSACFVSYESFPDWTKEEIRQKVCRDLPVQYEHEGEHYCVLHFPQNDKLDDFERTITGRKINKLYDFRHAYFPEKYKLNLDEHKFETYADFEFCVFNDEASFVRTKFLNEAHFCSAKFKSDVTFRETTFEAGAYFDSTEFRKEGDFTNANFNARFEIGKLSLKRDFQKVFSTNESFLLLQHARIEKPEKFVFYTVSLRPCWFIYVDSRKFNFGNIDWGKDLAESSYIKAEIENLKKLKVPNPQNFLIIACRQLAENAEMNNRFEEASKFRQMAFETERFLRKEKQLEWWNEEILTVEFPAKFWKKLKNAPFDFAYFLYRISSYYGESSSRAFKLLLSIIFLSSFFYWTPLSLFHETNNFRSLEFIEAISYSLRIMVLQRPEPFPANTFAKWVVALESIFAPLQAALLALAIRRKFMR